MEVLKGLAIAGPAGAVVGGVGWAIDTPFVSARDLVAKAKAGNLIEFDRGAYMHWAMYSDRIGYVINIPAEGKDRNSVTITEEKLVDVAGRSKVRINNQEKVAAKYGYKKRSANDAVAAAKADVGKTLPYNFLNTNCEYYATLWLYGNGFSVQVNNGTVGTFATTGVAQSQGVIGAMIGGIFGGPPGAAIGYCVATGAVGLGMSAIFEAAGTTHYTR